MLILRPTHCHSTLRRWWPRAMAAERPDLDCPTRHLWLSVAHATASRKWARLPAPSIGSSNPTP